MAEHAKKWPEWGISIFIGDLSVFESYSKNLS
jgi:hypothetical protein